MARPPTRTLPHTDPRGGVVQTIELVVVDGPQAGLTVRADEDRVQLGSAQNNDLVLIDPTVSRYHLELVRTDEGVQVFDHGSTNGTFVRDVRVVHAVVPPGTQLRVGQTHVEVRDGARRALELSDAGELGLLRGESAAMRKLFAKIRRAARSEVSVLLTGESGTGKELVARALHDHSARADGPFVVIDCASLSPTLIASELFGHEKGAFTGADRLHEGAFERANGGTLFLDEVGELPESLQPNLLGVLERRRFRRVGGKTDIATDVRLISATHRDLRAEVNDGSFRLDLFYRIAVVRLEIPPLRDRPEDVPMLIDHFLAEAGASAGETDLTHPATLARLMRYRWPGNVRELRNFVDATVAMGEAPGLEDGSAPESGTAPTGAHIAVESLLDLPYKRARNELVSRFQDLYLPHIVERAEGNVAKAARDSGMDRSHLWDLLRRRGLR